ncbi:MAG: glutamine synthetase family protein [Anaerolineae bacterium]|nr:glutamine synthetase family protein [Anaerolineae bacterium]
MAKKKPSDIDRVVQKAADAGVRLIRFLYTDNGGITRGKVTNVTRLYDRICDGIGLTVAMQAMNMLDQLAPVEGMGPVGEIRLTPDPATFRVLPYADKAAAMTVDMLKLDGTPWEACPRSFLKRQIKAAADLGIALQMAVEFEWTMATKQPDGNYVPLDETLCFSTTSMTIAHQVILDIVEALEAQHIPVELYYPELGHGQQEMTIHHTDPLAAADHHVFTRETIRNVAYKHGLYASLAPKPFLDQAGNGGHIHFSLWDTKSGRNLMYDASGAYNMSATGMSFIAGILEHLPGLLALTCASYNSYHRLQPHFWSSAYTAWGPDNREGAVRVASRYKSDEEGTANAELKAADLSMNPYLAYGALIVAGLDGVRRKLNPGEPTLVDPGNYSDAERKKLGIKRYPTSLKETVDALEQDKVLTGALGPLLTASYTAVKRLEYQTFSQQDDTYETKHHFWKF